MMSWLVALLLLAHPLVDPREPVTGSIKFVPVDDQKNVPSVYRMEPCEFRYEKTLKTDHTKDGYQVFEVKFPSAVVTKYPENNTVHCQYYRPVGAGPFPATVVLDILGGDQSLSKFQSSYLAKKGIACLFVQMAYYGPRRPAKSKVRLLMPDIEHSLGAVRQTVLDVRLAAAWLVEQKEVDKDRLGVVGTSLGSFMGTLSAEMEPRFKKVAIVLGGGGLVDAFYDHPMGGPLRALYAAMGGTREKLQQTIANADPITNAKNLKGREVLMIGAKNDEIVPPSACERMWKELGEPKIVWYEAGHYTAIFYIHDALTHVVELLKK